jgi:hypothetical protein
MERLKILHASIFTILYGVGTGVEIHKSFEAQELGCAVPIPDKPTAQACHDKDSTNAPPGDTKGALETAGNDPSLIPPADSWDHFADDGYEHDPLEMYA